MSAIATAAEYSPPARIFNGAEKAAALLLAMGKPLAGRLLKRFDQIELRQITRAAAQLGAVSTEALEHFVQEFTESFTVGADLLGNAAEAEQLLTGALPPLSERLQATSRRSNITRLRIISCLRVRPTSR